MSILIILHILLDYRARITHVIVPPSKKMTVFYWNFELNSFPTVTKLSLKAILPGSESSLQHTSGSVPLPVILSYAHRAPSKQHPGSPTQPLWS